MSRIEKWLYIIIIAVLIHVGMEIAADSIRNKQYPEPIWVQERRVDGWGIIHYQWCAEIYGERHYLKRRPNDLPV